MKNKYTFEYDFLMEKFMEEEPQTLDDMIPDCFNDWMAKLDVQEVIDYAQEYADELVIRNTKSICCDSEMTDSGQCSNCGANSKKDKNMSETTKRIIGYVAVDSGQIVISDPAYLKYWKDNEFNEKKKKKDFTYSGTCNITLSKEMGGNFVDEKFKEVGVAVSSGYGDGCYPVEATYEDGRIKEVKIVFFE